MSSVTARIKQIKQPRGGYIKPSQFDKVVFEDGIVLNEQENVHSSIVGMAADYLTRYMISGNKINAFSISIIGSKIARKEDVANELLDSIIGLDDNSVYNACKLVTFDVCYRSQMDAKNSKGYQDTNADRETIQNIQTFVKRSILFFEKYGPIISDGFNFNPKGYSDTVNAGDGDFITKDMLLDYKVNKSNPTSKQTLQLLMYWIMGQHSGQDIFKNIRKLGIYNSRQNILYYLNVDKIPESIIKTVETDVICYS